MRLNVNFDKDCFPSLLLSLFGFIFLVYALTSYKKISWLNLGIVSILFGLSNAFTKYICKKNTIIYWLLTPIPFLVFGYIVYDFHNNSEKRNK